MIRPRVTQIQYLSTDVHAGRAGLRDVVNAHNFHPTFGERGATNADARLRHLVAATRQPSVSHNGARRRRPPTPTTATRLHDAYERDGGRPLHRGEVGEKGLEFRRYVTSLARARSALAVGGQTAGRAAFPADEARAAGWRVIDPRLRARLAIVRRLNEFARRVLRRQETCEGTDGRLSCRRHVSRFGSPVVRRDTGGSKHCRKGGLWPRHAGGAAARSDAARQTSPPLFGGPRVANEHT